MSIINLNNQLLFFILIKKNELKYRYKLYLENKIFLKQNYRFNRVFKKNFFKVNNSITNSSLKKRKNLFTNKIMYNFEVDFDFFKKTTKLLYYEDKINLYFYLNNKVDINFLKKTFLQNIFKFGVEQQNLLGLFFNTYNRYFINNIFFILNFFKNSKLEPLYLYYKNIDDFNISNISHSLNFIELAFFFKNYKLLNLFKKMGFTKIRSIYFDSFNLYSYIKNINLDFFINSNVFLGVYSNIITYWNNNTITDGLILYMNLFKLFFFKKKKTNYFLTKQDYLDKNSINVIYLNIISSSLMHFGRYILDFNHFIKILIDYLNNVFYYKNINLYFYIKKHVLDIQKNYFLLKRSVNYSKNKSNLINSIIGKYVYVTYSTEFLNCKYLPTFRISGIKKYEKYNFFLTLRLLKDYSSFKKEDILRHSLFGFTKYFKKLVDFYIYNRDYEFIYKLSFIKIITNPTSVEEPIRYYLYNYFSLGGTNFITINPSIVYTNDWYSYKTYNYFIKFINSWFREITSIRIQIFKKTINWTSFFFEKREEIILNKLGQEIEYWNMHLNLSPLFREQQLLFWRYYWENKWFENRKNRMLQRVLWRREIKAHNNICKLFLSKSNLFLFKSFKLHLFFYKVFIYDVFFTKHVTRSRFFIDDTFMTNYFDEILVCRNLDIYNIYKFRSDIIKLAIKEMNFAKHFQRVEESYLFDDFNFVEQVYHIAINRNNSILFMDRVRDYWLSNIYKNVKRSPGIRYSPTKQISWDSDNGISDFDVISDSFSRKRNFKFNVRFASRVISKALDYKIGKRLYKFIDSRILSINKMSTEYTYYPKNILFFFGFISKLSYYYMRSRFGKKKSKITLKIKKKFKRLNLFIRFKHLNLINYNIYNKFHCSLYNTKKVFNNTIINKSGYVYKIKRIRFLYKQPFYLPNRPILINILPIYFNFANSIKRSLSVFYNNNLLKNWAANKTSMVGLWRLCNINVFRKNIYKFNKFIYILKFKVKKRFFKKISNLFIFSKKYKFIRISKYYKNMKLFFKKREQIKRDSVPFAKWPTGFKHKFVPGDVYYNKFGIRSYEALVKYMDSKDLEFKSRKRKLNNLDPNLKPTYNLIKYMFYRSFAQAVKDFIFRREIYLEMYPKTYLNNYVDSYTKDISHWSNDWLYYDMGTYMFNMLRDDPLYYYIIINSVESEPIIVTKLIWYSKTCRYYRLFIDNVDYYYYHIYHYYVNNIFKFIKKKFNEFKIDEFKKNPKYFNIFTYGNYRKLAREANRYPRWNMLTSRGL